MFYWIYDLSTEWMAILIAGSFVIFYWLGCIFIRPLLRTIARTRGANDLVGYILSCFGVFYGLLLGLIAVAAYQNYSQVEAAVQREAVALTALFYDVSSYPEPHRHNLRRILREYNRFVIKYAWPQQRKGIVPTGGVTRMNAFLEQLLAFQPETKAQEIIHAEAIHQFNVFLEHRTMRLQTVSTGIPSVMWYVVIVGAIINLIMVWLFDMRLITELILGGFLAFFLGTMIFLIAAMDNPFRGQVSISPEPFEKAAIVMMEE